jgi:hypothetical protein
LLSNRILEDPKQKAMFTKSQIGELFQLDEVEANGYDSKYNVERENSHGLPKAGQISLENAQVISSERGARRSSSSNALNNMMEEGEDEDDQIDNSNSNAANKQDHLVLKALFDGDAISSVYNHDYLEPKGTIVQNQYLIQNAANERVEKAMQALSSSSRVYLPTAAEETAANTSTSTRTQSSNSLAYHSSLNNNGGPSSASILGRIRSNRQNESLPPPPATTMTTTSTSTSSSDGNEVTSSSMGIADRIKSRILQLFEKKSSYSSEEVLRAFSDLGDQYAPIFKQTLRSVAVLRNGSWILR